MALTSKITQTLTVPGEAINVTIRKLSHHQLMMAVDARLEEAARKMRLLEGLNLPTTNEPRSEETVPESLANKYERLTVLRYGIAEWTYPVSVADGVEDLDEETASWLFDEICAFSLRTEAERKNSNGGSQHTSDPLPAAGPQS